MLNLAFPVNSSISQQLPGLQIAWDSTSLGELKLCPRKYFYRILHGWQPRELSVHLIFGLAFHAALECYDKARVEGRSHDEALHIATAFALRDTWNKQLKRPWISSDSYKNRTTLIRTVVWYLDFFADDPLETIQLANGKAAVELSFRIPLPQASPTGEQYFLCGHMDKMARLGEPTYIVDRKTTKSGLGEWFFNQFSPDNQFSCYLFAGRVGYEVPIAGLIVDAAQVGVGFSRFERQQITRTDEQLEEWGRDLAMWIGQAERYAEAGYWPQNDKACSLYGGCPFRGVCAKTPAVRDAFLRSSFERRVWDPLVVRGDV